MDAFNWDSCDSYLLVVTCFGVIATALAALAAWKASETAKHALKFQTNLISYKIEIVSLSVLIEKFTEINYFNKCNILGVGDDELSSVEGLVQDINNELTRLRAVSSEIDGKINEVLIGRDINNNSLMKILDNDNYAVVFSELISEGDFIYNIIRSLKKIRNEYL